ncbi:MAG: molecular chaperone GrpE [Solirubrobacteraceae bacterium]|nr:molecular chaperone GrpE [Solirubrobacteraceae bacterium]
MPSSPGSDVGTQGAIQDDASTAEPRSDASRDAEPDRDLAAELAVMEDRYKRALADLDNYRKRSTRETDRRIEESREALLREWLEALDSVERALSMDPGSAYAEGLRAVLEQMESILARHGVRRVGAAGEAFDPQLHEAVGVVPSDDVPHDAIAHVARSGFAVGDRTLRPAQVLVARGSNGAG